MASSTPVSKRDYILKSFFAGGIAGCCAKTTTAPLDRLKILLQARSVTYSHLGIAGGFKAIYQNEGWKGYYRGNGAMMVRVFPYAAIQFMSYEQYKKVLLSIHDGQAMKLLSGSLAGITAVAFTYPLDVIRARLAYQVTGKLQLYDGILHAFKKIYQTEGGIRAFYRGYFPTVLGMIPYAGLSFYTFETLKSLCLQYFINITTVVNHNGEKRLRIPASLLCGGVAGAVAQTISYPLDVVRRQMQLAAIIPDGNNERQWRAVLSHVVQKYGIVGGLYRGMSINYYRAIPQVAVSFATYELMKRVLKI
ncbi:Graves disease carrier protein-like protein [Trichoplax sp. H2]|nr:Graves disease carrier protein-like protein [Trichoplax sp. H2]|eukprot:RDD41436.1 Graves disease carrier protein-like protein [Trichoplax sp. H2]